MSLQNIVLSFIDLFMKKLVLYLAVVALFMLASCQTDSQRADKLRLKNRFDEAAELYQKAADKGDAYAMWRLANAYGNGDGVDWDEAKALELLRQSAQSGCEEAKSDLAFAYMFDWFNIGKDTDKGKKLLEDLIQTSKNSYVLSRYASLLYYGCDSYEEDEEKAMRVLNKIEDKDNPFYLSVMGEIYLNGTDKIEIDVEKAIKYLAMAFYKGRRYCAHRIQSTYASGYGYVKADKEKQLEWLNRGIDSNEDECMCTMALLCMSEDTAYQDIHNLQRAIELLKRASRHGNGSAYYILGNNFYYGEYLPKDDKKAFENWEKGFELKDINAASNLAYAYIEGVGCEKNEKKGIEIYKQAVEYGSGFSAYKLFCCYWTGKWGVEKNNDMAKMFLLKAAELGDSWGCFQLGWQYHMGNDLFDKDESQAFVYVKKAADMGLIDACNAIAYFYENGIGVDKDLQKAKEYRDKATVESKKEKD